MGFFDRLFGKKQVAPPTPSLTVAGMLKAAATDSGARAGALVFLGHSTEWYMCSEKERGDVPMAMVAPGGLLEVLAFSTPQAAIIQARTMSMGEGSTRPVIVMSPRDALKTFARMGASQIRFDIYQHDVVVTLDEIRKSVPGAAVDQIPSSAPSRAPARGEKCVKCSAIDTMTVNETPSAVITRSGFDHLSIESTEGRDVKVRCGTCGGSFDVTEMEEARMGDLYNWMWSSWDPPP